MSMIVFRASDLVKYGSAKYFTACLQDLHILHWLLRRVLLILLIWLLWRQCSPLDVSSVVLRIISVCSLDISNIVRNNDIILLHVSEIF